MISNLDTFNLFNISYPLRRKNRRIPGSCYSQCELLSSQLHDFRLNLPISSRLQFYLTDNQRFISNCWRHLDYDIVANTRNSSCSTVRLACIAAVWYVLSQNREDINMFISRIIVNTRTPRSYFRLYEAWMKNENITRIFQDTWLIYEELSIWELAEDKHRHAVFDWKRTSQSQILNALYE